MTCWAVIATGGSLKPSPCDVAAKVRHLPCVAVGNAYTIAPWAKALVACDATWWRKHPEARAFAGEKWCGNNGAGVPRLPAAAGIYTNTNSGLLGLHYAVTHGATRVLLLGIDMHGEHYFGQYVNGCANTDSAGFTMFIRQFEDYAARLRGVEVINCSLDSALEVFQKVALDEALGMVDA